MDRTANLPMHPSGGRQSTCSTTDPVEYSGSKWCAITFRFFFITYFEVEPTMAHLHTIQQHIAIAPLSSALFDTRFLLCFFFLYSGTTLAHWY